MSRISICLLTLAMIVSVSGCGGKGGVEKPSNPAPPPKKEDVKVI